MKWVKIKTEEDFPKDANKEVVVRATIGSDDVIADIADRNKIKILIENGWKVEWLDESIDQNKIGQLEERTLEANKTLLFLQDENQKLKLRIKELEKWIDGEIATSNNKLKDLSPLGRHALQAPIKAQIALLEDLKLKFLTK